ncbi:isoprenyl transferase [bacterium]|nr:isoprenyl transferase [candidate division CSSED10-310 bacterium]
MISRYPNTDADHNEIDPANIPRHIAIIMDGNGRWAKRRGLPRSIGHRAGVKSIERVMKACVELGVEVLTLYTFSLENWSRPASEINSLMELLYSNLMSQRAILVKNGVKLWLSGDLSSFPANVQTELRKTVRETTGCTKLILNLALGYSGREEILRACRRIAGEVDRGLIGVSDITLERFESHLYTAGLPDPDLTIRTSGEYRLSNFLLWQNSYAELHFTNVLWPNFSKRDLKRAILSYQQRDRRYGGVHTEEDRE